MKLVNIYDKVANKYSAPMLFDNEECAVRYFKTALVGKDSGIKDDYELYLIGDYSVDNGVLVPANHILLEKGINVTNEK